MYRQLFSASITPITILVSTLPILANPLNKFESSPQTTNIEAIVVTFPNNVEFDAGGNKQQPVVLRIVEPVYNNAGNVVIPTNSRVEALLVPVGKGKDKGTMIFAKSLIINGKLYPLNATLSNKIPARKISQKSRLQQANTYASSVSRFSPPVSTYFSDGTETQVPSRNTLLIQGVGAIIGYLNPRSILKSKIPQGSEYILHLQEPLSLDTRQNMPVVTDNSSPTDEYPLVDLYCRVCDGYSNL